MQGAALIAALLAQAASPAAPPPGVDLANVPEWVHMPSAQDLAAAYPDAARRAKVKGHAMLDCVLNEDGRLAGCKVADESPQGYGFGAAALRVSTRFQMTPLRPDGESVEGSHIQVPIYFGPRRR